MSKMNSIDEFTNISANRLIVRIVNYCSSNGLSIDEMAEKLCFSERFLRSMIRGERDIRDLSIDGYRQIAWALGISCFTALILADCLTIDDLVDYQH